MNETLSRNYTFEALATDPITNQQIGDLKNHYTAILAESRRYRKRVILSLFVSAFVFLSLLDAKTYNALEWIDWLLMITIFGSLGYLVWGWFDDKCFNENRVSFVVGGVDYGRQIHESMRNRESLLDPSRIEDIAIPREAVLAHRYIHAVIEKERRGYIGLDRQIIIDQISTP